MNGTYIYKDFNLNRGDIVQVSIVIQSNVVLLDSNDFQNFKAGRGFHYHGGQYDKSPVRIVVPSTGHWYVVIYGWGSGTIHYSVNILTRPSL